MTIVQRVVLLVVSILFLGASKTQAFGVVVQSARSVATTTKTTTSFWAADADDSTTSNDGAAESAAAEEVTTQTKAPMKAAADDILNSPDFLKRKLEVLQSDLAQSQQELEEAKARLEAGKAEWGAQLDDLAKEYKNIQTRMNTQSNASSNQATMQVARKMLDVLDNFDRAFGAVTAETDSEKEIEAEYRKAYDEILEIFARLGIEQVQTLGIEFDYTYHQAVMQRPSEEYEEGIVCEEFGKGFKIGDTLIRAAMVAVAA